MADAAHILEMRRRLDLPTEVTDAVLAQALAVASAMIDPRTDPEKVAALPHVYDETIVQLGIKVWDTSGRGMLTFTPDGEPMLDFTTVATAGMYRAVLGVAQPILRQGGAIVG